MAENGIGQRIKHGVESKILVPLAATIVSAATSYLIKKLPLILEQKVLPKLKEQGGVSGVRETVGEAVAETATTVKERAVEVVPALAGGEESSGEASEEESAATSGADEREEERRKREERRQERKRALQRA